MQLLPFRGAADDGPAEVASRLDDIQLGVVVSFLEYATAQGDSEASKALSIWSAHHSQRTMKTKN